MADTDEMFLRSMRHWLFDDETLVLRHTSEGGGYSYEVDLETMTTSAETLDWVFQVAKKHWHGDEGDSRCMWELLMALEILLRPQETLCSCGTEQGEIDPAIVIEGNIGEFSNG